MPNGGALTSTITALVFKAVGSVHESSLDDARSEANVALKRLRTVNGSFLSNLDYVLFLRKMRACRTA